MLATSSAQSKLPPSNTPSSGVDRVVCAAATHRLGLYGYLVHDLKPAALHRTWIEAISSVVATGASARRLLIVAPPGHAKSTWLSLIFPTWYLGNHPDHSLLFFTSSDTMARQFGGAVKATLEGNDVHHAVFPATENQPDSARGWSTDGLYLRGVPAGSKDPSYRALGYGASVVGSRAHGVILDDPLSQEQAESVVEQEKAIRYWDMTVSRRLHPDGWAIAIMTRWHESDLVARFVDKGDWQLLHTTTEGATVAPWPERFPVEWLKHEQMTMGGPIYACVYDGDPTSLGGDLFRDNSFQSIPTTLATGDLVRILAIDTAWSEKQTADYTAACIYGFKPGNLERYVLGMERHRVDDRDLARHLAEVILRWRPGVVGIEEAAFKQRRTAQLIAEIRLLLEGRYAVAIRAVPTDRDKVARARVPAARGEAGQLYANRSAPWFPDFLAECTGFPRRQHDDQVDALSLAEVMATEHDQYVQMADAAQSAMPMHIRTGAGGVKRDPSELEQMLRGAR